MKLGLKLGHRAVGGPPPLTGVSAFVGQGTVLSSGGTFTVPLTGVLGRVGQGTIIASGGLITPLTGASMFVAAGTVVASGGTVVIDAPVLTLVDGTVSPPTFTVDMDSTVMVGDTARLVYDDNSSFTSPTANDDVVITSDMVLDGIITFPSFTGLPGGEIDWRVRIVRGATLSAWSNTLTATIGAHISPTYRTGASATAPFDFSYNFTGITTYAGLKHSIMLSIENYGTAPVLTLDGETMTLRAQIEGSGSNGVYAYDLVPSSPGTGKTLNVASSFVNGFISFDMLTIPSTATYSSAASKGFDFVADPQVATGNLTVPSGGCGLVMVKTGGASISPNTGLTEVAERAEVGTYTMDATGLPSVNVGGAAGTMLLAVSYAP